MRRTIQLSLLCLVAGSASACKTADVTVPTGVQPYAGVRFINAVPDSAGAFGMDFRFIDMTESNAHFRINFRNAPSATQPIVSTQIEYKGALAGSRRFNIFLNDTIQAITKTLVKDTTVSLTALTNYTAMLWGNGRSVGADAMRLNFWTEDVADPAAQVAMRVINATNAPIDVRVYLQGGTVPAAATMAAVPAYSRSAYVLMAPGSYMYNVRAAGGAVNLVATDGRALPGSPASCSNQVCKPGEKQDIEAAPGTTVAGSAVSGIVFPRSTASTPPTVITRTPQTAAFQVPALTFMWDRRPPRLCSPVC